MRKLNECQLFYVKSQTCDKDFHARSFPSGTRMIQK